MRGVWLPLFLVVAGCGDNLHPNRAPTTEAFSLKTTEDIPVTRAVSAEDLDNDALEVLIPLPPSHGDVNVDGLTITYVPDPNFHGTDQFPLIVSDGSNEVSVTIDVEVTSVNDAPLGAADSLATDEDVPRTVPLSLLLDNDSDADGDNLSITQVGSPVNGMVAIAGANVTFTPTTNFNGGGSFIYTVTDGIETVDVTVSVVIGAANDAPIATDDAFTTPESTPITMTTAQLTANDTDPEGTILSISSVGNATDGTVALAGNGDVTFTPTTNFNGDATFTYTVTDGIATDVGLVTITVTPVNNPPVAVDDAVSQTGAANAIPQATLLSNDSDGGDGAALTITAVGNAVNGSITLQATTATFTPDADFAGSASFDYTISDGTDTDVGTVTVTVTAARHCGDGNVDAPEACDDGDNDNNDGCSATCTIEPGFDCTGSPSTCTPICNDGLQVGNEPCDDGDQDETDGCTTECVVGTICNATAFPGGDRFAVDKFTGHCYVSFDGDTTTFDDAEAACVAVGGYLATVTGAFELGVVDSVQNTAENPWIGAKDDANDTDNIFDWVTDEAFTITNNYAANEPDDDSGLGGFGECLHIADATGHWGDTNCTNVGFVQGRICEIEPVACGDSIVQPGEECDDANTADGDGCSSNCQIEGIFFSEYVEGSSFNKALEIRNPSATTTFDLLPCFIRTTFNGGTTNVTVPLAGQSIPPNDVLVVCHSSAGPALLANCDLTTNSSALTFNGDDTIELVCLTTVLDSIGQIGFDPGTEFGTGLTSTADNTLRRNCSVHHGDPISNDVFDPAIEWTGFATDTFSGLGSSNCP